MKFLFLPFGSAMGISIYKIDGTISFQSVNATNKDNESDSG